MKKTLLLLILVLICLMTACGNNKDMEIANGPAGDEEMVSDSEIEKTDMEAETEIEQDEDVSEAETGENNYKLEDLKKTNSVKFYDGYYYLCYYVDADHGYCITKYNDSTGEEEILKSNILRTYIVDNVIYYEYFDSQTCRIGAVSIENGNCIDDISNGKLSEYYLEYLKSCNDDYVLVFAEPLPEDGVLGEDYEVCDFTNCTLVSRYNGENDVDPTIIMIPIEYDDDIYADYVSDSYLDGEFLYLCDSYKVKKININTYEKEDVSLEELPDNFMPQKGSSEQDQYLHELAQMIANSSGKYVEAYGDIEVYHDKIIADLYSEGILQSILVCDSEGKVINEIMKSVDEPGYYLRSIGCDNEKLIYVDGDGSVHSLDL